MAAERSGARNTLTRIHAHHSTLHHFMFAKTYFLA